MNSILIPVIDFLRGLFYLKRNKQNGDGYIDFESRFILPLASAGMAISFVGLFINIWAGFNFALKIIPVAGFFAYGTIFYVAKHTDKTTMLKWLLFLLTLLFSNLLWLFNFGAKSPAPYMFILLYSFMIFMWNGKELAFVSLILFGNLGGIFFLDYNFPNLTGNYPTRFAQIIDVYTALLYYGLVMFILIFIAKTSYIKAYFDAKKADKLKSSFLTNMSHEIRTPLNAIVGFSNLLSDNDIGIEQKQRYIDIINESNDSLLRLIDDIIDVSLMESKQLALSDSDINLSVMLKNLEETYKLILEEKDHENILLTVEKPSEHLYFLGDATRLRQVFINLLDNAIRFTQNGSVTFGVREENEQLVFFVKDTGVGIEKKYHDKLFNRFFKIEKSSSKLFSGTGIGLYLCKSIINLMGGDIRVESEPGYGSMFSFTLPKKAFHKQKDPKSKVEEHHKKVEKPYLKALKILVVEDHPESREYLNKLLTNENMEVLQAFDGKSGVEMFKANPDINLILMDLKMPGMNGYEALDEIKKKNKYIPVIAQTAFATEKDNDRCMKAGFAGYISKPINKEVLFRLISETAYF